MKRISPLAVIYLTIFVDMLGIGILIPVFPQLIDPLSASSVLPPGATEATGYAIYGALSASYPLFMFLAAPILGQLSDRYGRRRILALCLAGTAFGYLIFALGIATHSLVLLFISRIIDGATGGNIAVAQAAVADVTKPEERAKAFGMTGAVFGLGFILGPVIGGLMASYGTALPFLFAAALAAANLVSVLLYFPETFKTDAPHRAIHWLGSVLNVGKAFAAANLRVLFTSTFLFSCGFGFFITFFSIILARTYGFGEKEIGYYFAYVGIWIVIMQAVLVRKLSGRDESKLIKYGMLGTAITVFLCLFPNDWRWLLAIVPLMSASNAVSFANLQSLISRSAGPERQGEIMGIASSLQALAGVVPPIVAGALAALFAPSATILTGAGLIAVAWLVFVLAYRRPAPLSS
jgi:DHA1 family tetracycline resistance protein-like MFS transporter